MLLHQTSQFSAVHTASALKLDLGRPELETDLYVRLQEIDPRLKLIDR